MTRGNKESWVDFEFDWCWFNIRDVYMIQFRQFPFSYFGQMRTKYELAFRIFHKYVCLRARTLRTMHYSSDFDSIYAR